MCKDFVHLTGVPQITPTCSTYLLFALGVFASYQDQLFPLWFVLLSSLICLGYYSTSPPPLHWRNLGWGSLFLILGLMVGKNDQRLAENHYSYIASSTEENSFQITNTKALRATQKNHRYYGNIHKVNGQRTMGAILIHFQKSIQPLFH